MKDIIREGVVVEGEVASGFGGVPEQFLENFRSRGELGASVCITVGGGTKLDLWGGISDPASGREDEQHERVNQHLRVASGLLSLAFGLFLVYRIGFVDGLFSGHPRWTPQ